MIPAIQVDNFFNNPNDVRLIGLSVNDYTACSYTNPERYSGYRSIINDKSLNSEIHKRLEQVSKLKITRMGTCFNLNTKASMFGFPHFDTYGEINKFAGIIYLNEDFPDEDCGTKIYHSEQKNQLNSNIENYRSKMAIVYNPLIDPEDPIKKQFALECLKFKQEVLKVSHDFTFEFNRLVLYSGEELHAADHYFGETKDECRMTITIFGECEI